MQGQGGSRKATMQNTTLTEWVKPEIAALRLEMHQRTAERHAASGKLTSRRTADGKLEIEVPALAPTVEVTQALHAHAEREMQLVAVAMQAKTKELESMQQQLNMVKRWGAAGYGVAAVLALSMGGTIFAWHSASVEVATLGGQYQGLVASAKVAGQATTEALKQAGAASAKANDYAAQLAAQNRRVEILQDEIAGRQFAAELPYLARKTN